MMKSQKVSEIILVILIWVVIIAAPLFLNDEDNFETSRFIKHQIVNIPVFIVFIINRIFLVPKILVKKRRFVYIGSVLFLIAAVTFGSYLFQPAQREPFHSQTENSFSAKPGNNNGVQHDMRQSRHMLPPPPPMKKGNVPPFMNVMLFSLLLVGFDTGLMTSFRLAKTEKEKAKLEKENIENQLAFLRNQLSPHFFMNTLNNIHAQIDFNSEEAKVSIIKLSKLMRHILYDSDANMIPIKQEMDFVTNYVGLMRLRTSEKVKIDLKIQTPLPEKVIPPLLFISFIENAFKHGVSYKSNSFVDITVKTVDNWLNINISNSKHDNKKDNEKSGIGVANAMKRLELIYKNNYNLKIIDNKDIYSIILNIPL